jgi:cysteine/O-acetylserine efflux protein
MSIIGGAYMVYLAIKILINKPKARKDTAENTFMAGLTLQFINPKVILYGITAISTFVIPYYRSSSSLILFSMLLALVGFIATSCWAFFGSILQNFLTKYNRLFNLCMSILLFYCAISILWH